MLLLFGIVFFFQAEDGIRDLVRSRGLGDVYKRQVLYSVSLLETGSADNAIFSLSEVFIFPDLSLQEEKIKIIGMNTLKNNVLPDMFVMI